MNVLLDKEVQLRDLRHLAGEICDLVNPLSGPPASHYLVAELAQTTWQKLHTIGPLMDGYGSYFRALDGGNIEWLFWDEVEGASPIVVCNALAATERKNLGFWRCLKDTQFCSEDLYRDVKYFSLSALPAAGTDQAQQRWEEAEQQLLAEGVLPVRLLAPSAAGGRRYVCEMSVADYMLGAFRETLAEWGAFLISRRPITGARILDSHLYTVSLEQVDDQFVIGKQLVYQHYADLAEEKGGQRHG